MTWISDFKVHTRSNLSVKGIVPDATFVVCGRAVEDATHVLLRAPGSSGNSSALAWLIVMPLTTTTLHRLRLPPAHAPGVQHLRASLLLAFVETEKCCVQQGSPPLSTPSVVRRWLPNRRLDSPPPFYLCVYLSFVFCSLSPLSVYANAWNMLQKPYGVYNPKTMDQFSKYKRQLRYCAIQWTISWCCLLFIIACVV